MADKVKYQIKDECGVDRTLNRLAMQILERNSGSDDLVLVGIRTRGAPLAERLSKIIAKIDSKESIPVGALDITFYRDDFLTMIKTPEVKATEIDFDIHDKDVILVDDVLYTGRTVRAAIDAILDYGRPKTIQLAVLIDRGHREMPIQGDFVGRTVQTSPGEEVVVRLKEIDGIDEVDVIEKTIPKPKEEK